MSRSEAQAAFTMTSATTFPLSTPWPEASTERRVTPRSAVRTVVFAVGCTVFAMNDATAQDQGPPTVSPVLDGADTHVIAHAPVDGQAVPEAVRWAQLLARLERRVEDSSLSPVQRERFLMVWREARSRSQTLRRPAVGVSVDGHLEAGWSFVDLPGRTFTIEIHRDGGVDWFFRDARTGAVEGAGDELPTGLPANAMELLVRSFS